MYVFLLCKGESICLILRRVEDDSAATMDSLNHLELLENRKNSNMQ